MYATDFFLLSGEFPVAHTAEIGQELSLLGLIEIAEHTPRDAVLVHGPAIVDGVQSQSQLLYRKWRVLSAIPGVSRFLHARDWWVGRLMEGSLVRLVFEFLGSTVLVASLALRVVLGVLDFAAKALWLGHRLRVPVVSLNVA